MSNYGRPGRRGFYHRGGHNRFYAKNKQIVKDGDDIMVSMDNPNAGHFSGTRGFRGGKFRGDNRGNRGRGRGFYHHQHNWLDRIPGSYQERKQAIQQQSAAGRAEQTWSKIHVPQGRALGKEFILESLSSYTEGPMHPILFRWTEGGDALFYLEDNNQAEAIKAVSRRIVAPNGLKLLVNVNSCPPPFAPVSADDEQILTGVLSSRFNPANNSLDLTNFNADQAIQQAGKSGYLSLQRGAVLFAVVKIIGEKCPQVQSIDLSHNRLRTLDFLANLVSRAPTVTNLVMNDNQIEHIRELEKLSGWKLHSLELHMNPLCNLFKEKNTYISAVRKVFPTVMILDAVDLPPAIGFDLDAPSTTSTGVRKVPVFKPSFTLNDSVKTVVHSFLEQFYTVYDSGNREQLLDAYDDQATLTMTCFAVGLRGMSETQNTQWRSLISDSHNICNMPVWERRRQKLIHRGRLAIASYLQSLPRTAHDPASFLIDVSFVSGNVMSFNVSGLFREATDEGTLRYFNRTFMVVPRSDGTSPLPVIINDLVYFSLLQPEHGEEYMALLATARTNDTNAATATASAVPASSHAIAGSSTSGLASAVVTHEELIARFAAETRMKPEWAKKALEENAWDYATSMHAFAQLKDAIPREAFI